MSDLTPPLVGRAAVVAEVVRRARTGQGTALTGLPGSGGSRLLDEVQQALRRVGSRTARLRVLGPAAAESPFLALFDRSTADGLRGSDRVALQDAVLALRLDLLTVEDAHLLGAADGALVVEAARAGTAVVANATGPGGMSDALHVLVDEGRAIVHALGPLTDEEVTDLAEQLLGDPVDGELAHALLVASEARPGTLAELVDDGIGSQSIVHVDGLWRLRAPLPAPRSVRAATLEAFSALPPDQRGWIAAVAVARGLAQDLAPRIAARATITAAEDAGWTARTGQTRIRITSLPVATAIVGSLDVRARIAVLRRLTDAATSARRSLTDDERVALARWRVELGEAVDPHEALALAERPETEADNREVLLRAALDGGAPAGPALADHLRRTRRTKEAIALIAAALPGARSDDERVSLIRVATMTTGIAERRSAEALEALDAHLATRSGHPDLVAVRAGLLLLEGRPREAVETAESVLRTDGRSVFAAAFAHLQLAVGLRELGDLDGALDAAHRFTTMRGVEQAYAAGAALARWLPSEIAVAVGAGLDQAEAVLIAEHATVAPERRPVRRPALSYTLGSIRLHRGDPVGAVRLLREADGGSGAWRESWRPRVLAELTIAQTLSGSVEDAGTTHERLLRLTCPPVQRARVRLAAAQLHAARGDRDSAIAVAAEVAEEGRRRGLALDAFDGAFAGIRYGDARAPDRLLALGDLPPGIGRQAQRAYAAGLVADDGSAVDRAAQRLWDVGLRLHAIEAAARAAGLGSDAAARRLVAWRTRTPGLRLPDVARRRANGLTEREREVALLAARGVSDRTIAAELGITLRTAQTHLGRALAKLGIHRRTELSGLIGEP